MCLNFYFTCFIHFLCYFSYQLIIFIKIFYSYIAFYTKSKKKDSKKAFAYIDKDYGWTYKVNNNFTFPGLCNLIDQREYKDFKLMSMYSHGTAIHLKIGSFASMDHVFKMLSFFDYILNRLVALYCCETVDEAFAKTSKKLERIIKLYIKECS